MVYNIHRKLGNGICVPKRWSAETSVPSKTMITKIQSRDKCGEHFEQPSRHFLTPGEALSNMLEVELAFGGQIVMLTPTKITLVTYVLDCEDHATYEGPIGEMESLCQLSVTILQGERQFKGVIIEGAWHSMEQTFGMKVGKPLLMKMLAWIAFGRSRLRAAVLLSAGISNEDDVGLAVESKVSLKDLAACADLARQSGMPFREALALV